MKKKINARKVTAFLCTLALLSSQLPVIPAFAGTALSDPVVHTIYENTFDNGKNSVVAYENDFLTYAGVEGEAVRNAEHNGNVGITASSSGTWVSGRTFCFDFTKGGTQNPVRTGKVSVSFDYMLSGEPSNSPRIPIGMNMTSPTEGGRMFYFTNSNTDATLAPVYGFTCPKSIGAWSYFTHTDYAGGVFPGADGKVHSFKIVMDFDNGLTSYYLDNSQMMAYVGDEEVAISQSLEGREMENFAISFSGLMAYFDNLKITHEFVYPFECEIVGDRKGNNFYDNEDINLDLVVTNRSNTERTETVRVWSTNQQGTNEATVYEEAVTVPAYSSKTISLNPDLSAFGSYYMYAESDNSLKFTTRVARSVRSKKLNENIGIHSHLTRKDHAGKDIAMAFDLMEAAGIQKVRSDQYVKYDNGSWTVDEKARHDQMIRESKEHGIDVLALIEPGTTQYATTTDNGGFDTTQQHLDEIYEWCYWIANTYKDSLKYFEFGNEDHYVLRPVTQEDITNGETVVYASRHHMIYNGSVYKDQNNTAYSKDKCTITVTDGKVTATYKSWLSTTTVVNGVAGFVPDTGTDYAKLLKVAYEAIKDANPEAVVMTSGGGIGPFTHSREPVENSPEFTKSLLEAINADPDNTYYDVWALHSYHRGSAPEEKDRYKGEWSFVDTQDDVTDVLKSYGHENAEKWATEVGYEISPDNERLYASWLARMLALNFMGDEYGPYHDKYFVFKLFNTDADPTKNDTNWGIVNHWKNQNWYNDLDYAAKESYIALAQFNNLMTGAEFVSAEIDKQANSGWDPVSNGDEYLSKGRYVLKFQRDDADVYMAWDAARFVTNNETLTLAGVAGKHMTVYDMFGNVLQETGAGAGVTNVALSTEPIYIEVKHADPEILLFRDYEDYAGGNVILNSSDKKYGTFDFQITSNTYNDAEVVKDADGKAVKVNSAALTHRSKSEILANPVSSGTLYMGFDIAKKPDSELSEADTGNSFHFQIWHGAGTGDYNGRTYLDVTHTNVATTTVPWRGYFVDRITDEKIHRVEYIWDFEKMYCYIDGVKTNEIARTTQISGFDLIMPEVEYFDNLAIVHYPGKAENFSMYKGEVDKSAGTISVFYKNDLKDVNDTVTYEAPYSASLTSMPSFTVTNRAGETLSTTVAKGDKPGEYVITLADGMEAGEKYTVTSSTGIYDILGGTLNEKAKTIEVETPAPTVLFYRDYEDYTGGKDIYNSSDLKYGIFNLQMDLTPYSDATAVEDADGKAVKTNSVSLNTRRKSVALDNPISSGTLYMGFDIAKKPDSELPTSDDVGGTGASNNSFHFQIWSGTGASDYNGRTYLDVKHTNLATTTVPWRGYFVDRITDEKIHRVEYVWDFTKMYCYIDGVKVSEIARTTQIVGFDFIMPEVEYFDNFSLVHYPGKAENFSVSAGAIDLEEGTLSVFYKNDAEDASGLRAPYTASFTAMPKLTVTNKAGQTVASTVAKGDKPGKYVITLTDGITVGEEYTVTSEATGLIDVLGGTLNEDGKTVVFDASEPVVGITQSGHIFTANVKGSATVQNPILVVASYTGERLTNVIIDTKPVANGAWDTLEVNSSALTGTVKAFLFDGFASLKPLCELVPKQ